MTLFLDPHEPIEEPTYSRLSELGFRRSGDHLYRPHCPQCKACIPARIPVESFQPNRQQSRILKRNRDLELRRTRPRLTDEIYELYSRYINARHADGDMYPPSRQQFQSFLVSSSPFCEFIEFRSWTVAGGGGPTNFQYFLRSIPSSTPSRPAAASAVSPSCAR